MTEDPKFLLCHKCDGWIGSCGGHRADCPVTRKRGSLTMRRILWAYMIGLALVIWGLYQLWNKTFP